MVYQIYNGTKHYIEYFLYVIDIFNIYYISLWNSILLQNFYKTELNKEEMYIRYIHKLYDLHLKAQNFTGNEMQTRKST